MRSGMETKKSDSKRLANVDILILPIFYSYLTPFNERRTHVSDFLREAFSEMFYFGEAGLEKKKTKLGRFFSFSIYPVITGEASEF